MKLARRNPAGGYRQCMEQTAKSCSIPQFCLAGQGVSSGGRHGEIDAIELESVVIPRHPIISYKATVLHSGLVKYQTSHQNMFRYPM